MKVIEFAGVQGCGKSTLHRRLAWIHRRARGPLCDLVTLQERRLSIHIASRPLAERLVQECFLCLRSYRDWFVRYRFRKVLDELAGAAIASNLDLTIEAVRATADQPDAVKRLAMGLFVRCLAERHYAEMNVTDDEVFLADEGFVQRAMSFYLSYDGNDLDDRIARYVSQCPQIHALVHVKADHGVCLERLRQRSDVAVMPRYGGMAEGAILESFERSDHILEKTVDAFRRRGTAVIDIDSTSSDVAALSRRCVEYLQASPLAVAPVVSTKRRFGIFGRRSSSASAYPVAKT
jgi:hypothetical protein